MRRFGVSPPPVVGWRRVDCGPCGVAWALGLLCNVRDHGLGVPDSLIAGQGAPNPSQAACVVCAACTQEEVDAVFKSAKAAQKVGPGLLMWVCCTSLTGGGWRIVGTWTLGTATRLSPCCVSAQVCTHSTHSHLNCKLRSLAI